MPTKEQAAAHCAALSRAVREAHAAGPELADAVFSPHPGGSAVAALQIVRFRGVRLPLPAASYRCVPMYDGAAKRFDLGLIRSGQQEMVLLARSRAEPFEDLFQKVYDPGPARTALTHKLFGRPPTLYDLEDLAFSLRASEFRCDADSLLEATRRAYALVLKTTGARAKARVRVHRGVGLADSHLLVGEAEDGRLLLRYSYRHRDDVYDLSIDSRDRAFVAAAEAALAYASAGGAPSAGPEELPFEPLCAEVIALVDQPSGQQADKVARLLPEGAEQARVKDTLNRYLKDLAAQP